MQQCNNFKDPGIQHYGETLMTIAVKCVCKEKRDVYMQIHIFLDKYLIANEIHVLYTYRRDERIQLSVFMSALLGGSLFNSVREEADDLFVKLPPPTQKVDSFDWSAWGDAGAGR